MIGLGKIRIQVDERQVISVLLLILLVLGLVPLLIFGITILISPGNIMPFLYDPRGSKSLLWFCLWEALGIGLFVNATRKGFHPLLFRKLITTIIVFVFPFCGLYVFGPIVLKIIDNSGSHKARVVAPDGHHREIRQPEKVGL